MSREWPTEGGAQEIDVGTWDLPSSTTTLYIGGWVWFDALGAVDSRFISKASSSAEAGHRWMLGKASTDDLRARIRYGGTTFTFIATNALAGLTNQWVHVAVSAGSGAGGTDLYVNGVEVAGLSSGSGDMSSGDTSDVFIGNQPGTGGNSNAINGRQADFIVTTYRPTAEQIAAFAAGVPHSALLAYGGVQGYWPLLGQGSSEPDFSGQGRNGTVDAGITVADQPPLAPIFGYDEPYSAFVTTGAINESLTFAAAATIASAKTQDVVESLALDTAATLTVSAAVNFVESLNLDAAAFLETRGGQVFNEALLLDAASTLAITTNLTINQSINIAAAASLLQTEAVTFNPAFDLAAAATFLAETPSGGNVFNEALTLTIAASLVDQNEISFSEALNLAAAARLGAVATGGIEVSGGGVYRPIYRVRRRT